jgi:hypothetical protein
MNPMGTLLKPGLATAVMENATDYGSTKYNILSRKTRSAIPYLGS